MFELTTEQAGALDAPAESPVRVIDPRTRREYVLVPADEYKRLMPADYDDTGFTREERDLMRWRIGHDVLGWDDMDVYDQLPEKS